MHASDDRSDQKPSLSVESARAGDPVLGNRQDVCSCAASQRRGFLTGLLAAGAGTLLSACSTPAQLVASRTRENRLIDTHHHLVAPAHLAALEKANEATPPARSWSISRTLEDMEKAGVATSILSPTTPHVSFLDSESGRRVARESNEWTAKLSAAHPGRFGFFAMLPMQDIDGSLREIEFSLDKLKADGIAMPTNLGDKWLGHPSFSPIMNELNRRKAIVYTHPTTADCCRYLLPGIPPTVVEFGTDTTRTITDIVFSGTAARCPDLRFIFSHGGGTLPYLVERMVKMPTLDPRLKLKVPRGVEFELARFYYDTAWVANPVAMAALTRFVSPSQILFGSDFPYRTGEDNVKGLSAHGFTSGELRAIERDNAARLFPRFQT